VLLLFVYIFSLLSWVWLSVGFQLPGNTRLRNNVVYSLYVERDNELGLFALFGYVLLLLLLHDLYSANFEDRIGGAGVARWRTWLTGEGKKVCYRWRLIKGTNRRWMSDVECTAVVDAPTGHVTLGASMANGIEQKGIDSLQQCLKKCASAGLGIPATVCIAYQVCQGLYC